MNYLLKSKPKHEYRFKTIAIVSIFVVLSALAFFFNSGMRSIFTTIAKPIWSMRDMATGSFGNIYDFFSLQKNLVMQNVNLKEQVDLLNLKVIDHDTILKENQDLKAMFGRNSNTERLLSRVLSKPPQSPYDTLVIDVGSGDGVKMGSKVYTSENIIIGMITSVTPHTSLVELFSTGDKKTEVVLERTGASYEIVGSGGANLSIQTPKDSDILWGDVFVYPGLTPSVIGTVYYIDTNSQSSFKKIFLRIPGNVFQSKWLFVDKGV